jgi:PleD family two-component response regulator
MRNFIAKAVSAGQSFALVFTRITNYRRLVLHTERAVLEKALNDLGQRLAQILQEGDVRGRWSEEEFVALVTADRPRAMQASRDITFRCSGPYPVQVSGRNTTISLSVASGVVEPKSHESVEDLLRRSDQLLRILIGDR